jgi:hypothetical protein
MRLKLALSFAAVAGLLSTAKPVTAASNLFFPFSGYRFAPQADAFRSLVQYSAGRITNISSGAFTVEASLGHASGGANGFTIYGNVSRAGTVMTCSVFVIRQQDTFKLAPFTASTPALPVGHYSLFVRATPPNGAYFYTLSCLLPAGADITGVRPDA